MQLRERGWTAEQEGDLEAIMDTLVADPVYEFHPAGNVLRGRDINRRMYEAFLTHQKEPNDVVGHSRVNYYPSEDGNVEEYLMQVREPDGSIRDYGRVSIVAREGDLIAGERVYASERLVRELMGPFFDDIAQDRARPRAPRRPAGASHG